MKREKDSLFHNQIDLSYENKTLKSELEKFGAEIKITSDSLEIIKVNKTDLNKTIIIQTYNDHRMAMSFASMKFIYPNLQIVDPEVVSKSFPRFWDEFKKLEFL